MPLKRIAMKIRTLFSLILSISITTRCTQEKYFSLKNDTGALIKGILEYKNSRASYKNTRLFSLNDSNTFRFALEAPHLSEPRAPHTLSIINDKGKYHLAHFKDSHDPTSMSLKKLNDAFYIIFKSNDKHDPDEIFEDKTPLLLPEGN